MHLSGIWMLTDFTTRNGGTFIVPGSHKLTDNPAGETLTGFDKDGPHPDQLQVTGTAGSVLLYDSRLWHAVAANVSDDLRVALIIRYAPWWLNLTPSIRGTPDHDRMVLATGGKNYDAVPMRRTVFERLPADVQPLYQALRHRRLRARPRSTTATARATTSCRPPGGSRTRTVRSTTAGATTSSTSTTRRTSAPSAAIPSGAAPTPALCGQSSRTSNTPNRPRGQHRPAALGPPAAGADAGHHRPGPQRLLERLHGHRRRRADHSLLGAGAKVARARGPRVVPEPVPGHRLR